jgi:hypothetical protein
MSWLEKKTEKKETPQEYRREPPKTYDLKEYPDWRLKKIEHLGINDEIILTEYVVEKREFNTHAWNREKNDYEPGYVTDAIFQDFEEAKKHYILMDRRSRGVDRKVTIINVYEEPK